MTHDETLLIVSRRFDARPDVLFDAWLDRAQFQSWIGPEGIHCEVPLFEPHVGGRFRIIMHMSDTHTVTVGGEFRVIERPHSLVFTRGLEGHADRISVVTLTLREAANGKTDLTLSQEGLGSIENRDMHGGGWESAFRKLDRHLAQE